MRILTSSTRPRRDNVFMIDDLYEESKKIVPEITRNEAEQMYDLAQEFVKFMKTMSPEDRRNYINKDKTKSQNHIFNELKELHLNNY
jgi:hypothetical protein